MPTLVVGGSGSTRMWAARRTREKATYRLGSLRTHPLPCLRSGDHVEVDAGSPKNLHTTRCTADSGQRGVDMLCEGRQAPDGHVAVKGQPIRAILHNPVVLRLAATLIRGVVHCMVTVNRHILHAPRRKPAHTAGVCRTQETRGIPKILQCCTDDFDCRVRIRYSRYRMPPHPSPTRIVTSSRLSRSAVKAAFAIVACVAPSPTHASVAFVIHSIVVVAWSHLQHDMRSRRLPHR